MACLSFVNQRLRLAFLWTVLVTLIEAQTTLAQNATNTTAPESINGTSKCLCGFQDPITNNIFTDSLIVYFNETNTSVPTDLFSVDSFEHRYEKGWNVFFREGASAQNVYFEQGSVWNLAPSWLNLNVSAATPEHLVNGAQLQTARKDIHYGSFRVFMKGPQPYAGGSALTMRLEHNDTVSVELDLQNMDDSQDDACMQTTTGRQEPLTANGVNFTLFEQKPYDFWPWDFWEWRMDWTEQDVEFYAGANKTRTIPTANASMIDTPSAFFIKHWSNGDINWMQGPPTSDTTASIGYVRLFFNSSLTSESKLGSADCDASAYCSTEDWTLRANTPYTPAMTERDTVRVPQPSRSSRVGIALIVASLACSAALVAHALIRKASGRKAPRRTAKLDVRRPKMHKSPMPSDYGHPRSQAVSEAWTTGRSRPVSEAWTVQTDLEMDTLRPMIAGSSTTLLGMSKGFHPGFAGGHERTPSKRPFFYSPYQSSSTFNLYDTAGTYDNGNHDSIEPLSERMDASTADLLRGTPTERRDMEAEGSAAAANPGAKPVPAPGAVPQARTRIDYLAGLVAVCSLLVSCTHFILTFVPSVIEQYLPQHYESEYWARVTIEPFFFNEVWVGLFFTTSTRFLTSGYLRTGSLKTVAEKIVSRCPRLMIPITAVIIFEYFLMDLGAVTYLEYIPSISWSTWPSTSVYTNFGWFVDETLQLFYIIPNAAPQLTWNFCTGVLWTIPVQLQNSWLVLLGVVIIKEIKTPWKRFAYYAFCIISHWYALSWGSYFWFGLVLADLDITYKYRKLIHSKFYIHYPLLLLACIIVFLSLANDAFTVWTGYTFSTDERGIHPEVQSSLPLAQTALAGYPSYIEPKLNGLAFAVASQYIVELSTWVQAVLSTKVFLWLFPHVFTIYLIHGLIFWSIGSLVCVYFAGLGFAYWLNILLTALICYSTLFACLPIVTPVMEMLGKEITKTIWVSASEEPAPWRPSSYPLAISEITEMVTRKDDDI